MSDDDPFGGDGPSGDSTGEIILWLETTSPTQAADWIEQHAGDLSVETAQAVHEWVVSRQSGAPEQAFEFATAAATLTEQLAGHGVDAAQVAQGVPDQPQTIPEQVDQERFDQSIKDAATRLSGSLVNIRLQGGVAIGSVNQLVESNVPDWIPADQRAEWINQTKVALTDRAETELTNTLIAGGMDPDAAARSASQWSQDLNTPVNTPTWMMELNQGLWTPEQLATLVDYYNDAHGLHYRNWQELAPHFESHNADNEELANAALAEQQPARAMSISIPGRGASHPVMMNGRLVTVHDTRMDRTIALPEEQVATLMARGFTPEAITRMVRLGGMYGLPGQDDMADADRVTYLTALTLALGGANAPEQLAQVEQRHEDIAELERQLGLKPGQANEMTAAERKAWVEKRARERGIHTGGMSGIPEAAQVSQETLRLGNQLEGLLTQQFRAGQAGANVSIMGAQNNFNIGLQKYNQSGALALIHAVDPNLAERVAASGGDPDKLDPMDNIRAIRIFERAGIMEGDKWFGSDNVAKMLRAGGYWGGGGGGGGGGGRIRRVVDPVSVKENLSAMFQGLLLGQPSDELVSSFTKDLQSKLDAAPEGMNFDTGARITEFLKGLPQYQELYGQKPAAVSEEEYQAQFRAAQASMLGAEATSTDAVKQGMRTGQYQTTVGAAAASSEAWNNSTFLGRLARAAQVVDQMT